MDFSGDGGPKITIEPDRDQRRPVGGAAADRGRRSSRCRTSASTPASTSRSSDAPARFRFSFATQDNPFTLSVAIFGGGGFFGIAIGTDGVELIQASFDFGAMASIDLGVASGSVSLIAGHLLRLRPDRPAIHPDGLHPHRVRQARRQPQHPRDHHAVARVRPEPHLRGSRRRLVGHRHRDADGRRLGLLLQLLGVGDRAEDVRRRPGQQLRRQPRPAPCRWARAPMRRRRSHDQMSQSDWNNYCAAFAAS